MPVSITVTIPDAWAPDAQAALSAKVGLPVSGPNAKLGLIDILIRETKHWRIKNAADAATATAAAAADTDVTGVT